jgi:hypothetical protein
MMDDYMAWWAEMHDCVPKADIRKLVEKWYAEANEPGTELLWAGAISFCADELEKLLRGE